MFPFLAITYDRSLQSVRDLNFRHLSLLKSIKQKSVKTIMQKYKFKSEEIVAFFHYPPSYYHLHVHFMHRRLMSATN